MSDDHLALAVALHAERTEANSLHVDCWACEAARSKAIADLLTELRRAQSALGATEAVLDTNVALTAAGSLYRASGYVEIEPYNDNPNATLWFAKPLD